MILITVLTKLGIYNKHTKPILDKLGGMFSYLYRFWMLFNLLLTLYLIGMIGPWEIIKFIKNTFNNLTDFYNSLSQSFIDYLKHLFGKGPKPPKPELPKSGGGGTETRKLPIPYWKGGRTPDPSSPGSIGGNT